MKNIDIARLTPETWPARREALVKLFGQEEYGVVPAGWTSSFVWEKELEKDGLHGRLGCVTVEYKGRSMSFLLHSGCLRRPVNPCPARFRSAVMIPWSTTR